ncbi:MAG: hypothetical protein V3R87_03045 [Dehalococcoidia bacterium]
MITVAEFVKQYKRILSIRMVGGIAGISYRQAHNLYKKAVEQGLLVARNMGSVTIEERKAAAAGDQEDVTPAIGGRLETREARSSTIPKKGEVKRYILSAVQNNTTINEELWINLKALAKHYKAEIILARTVYNRFADASDMDKKLIISGAAQRSNKTYHWDKCFEDYFVDERKELAPGLVWVGETNVIPTSPNPLVGFNTYTHRDSMVMPHNRIAMRSVPTHPEESTKLMYTTGTLSHRNYIQRKAGQLAEFHHCFHPDTEFLTHEGLRTLGEMEGQETKVWSGEAWESASIRAFGEQELFDVELAPLQGNIRNGTDYRKRVSVTGSHTWHLTNGRVTAALREGDKVKGSRIKQFDDTDPDYLEGVRHGLILGDGSVIYKSVGGVYSHQLCMHGARVAAWAHLFDNITVWPSRTYVNNYVGTAYHKSKRNYKELPQGDVPPAYLRGVLVGWLAADGHQPANGKQQLCSVDKTYLQWVQAVAPYAGLISTGICKGGSGGYSSFGKERRQLWRITLSDAPVDWLVTKMTPAGKSKVLCAVVEPSHRFTLAGGVLTGNCYGAALVEVDDTGTWFVRQLNSQDDGVIYDWDLKVEDGRVTTGNRLEAINWGDLHPTYEDPVATELALRVLDQLKPKYQLMHDLIDNRVVNPHRPAGKKHIQSYIEYQLGHRGVLDEMRLTAKYLCRFMKPFVRTVVVASNHDLWLKRWLELADFRQDKKNATYFLRAASYFWQYMEDHPGKEPNLTAWAMGTAGVDAIHAHPTSTHYKCLRKGESFADFLDEDDSFLIAGKIECGMHGHQGANGTRGTAGGLSKFGRRANIGDKHTCGIYDGLYVAGILGKLDQGYNAGPGSWSQTQIFTYASGKRTLVTFFNGKARA